MHYESEPIDIKDNTFFVNSNISTAPAGMVIRELLQNCMEARVLPTEKERNILIAVTEDNKLAILNSGVGISNEEMIDCTDFSKSVGKVMGMSARQNRGEGAKIACMRFNPEGFRLRSRKDGLLWECFLYLDKEKQYWARRKECFVDDNGVEEYESVYGVIPTQSESARYSTFKDDFTEVVLYGAYDGHKTWLDLYQTGNTEQQSVPYDVFSRYYKFPDIGIPIKVKATSEFRGGATTRPIVPVGTLIETRPTEFENHADRYVKLPSGIKLEFVKTNKSIGNRTPWTQFSMGRNGGRGALVWQGELYDVHEDVKPRRQWPRKVGNFGLTGLSSEMSLFIHLPEDFVSNDGRFRDKLFDKKGAPISLSDFEFMVIANRPQWVIDLINESKPKASDGMKDVYALLKDYAVDLQTKPFVNGPNFLPVSPTGDGEEVEFDHTKKRGPNVNTITNPTGVNSPNNSPTVMRVSTKSQLKIAAIGGGSNSTQPTVPQPVWVEDHSINPDLQHRGALFIRSSCDLWLNLEYPTFKRITDKIFESLRQKTPALILDERVKLFIDEEIKKTVALAIGKSVLRSLSLKSAKGWDNSAMDRRLHQDNLSAEFDSQMDAVPQMVDNLTSLRPFKDLLREVKAEGLSIAA